MPGARSAIGRTAGPPAGAAKRDRSQPGFAIFNPQTPSLLSAPSLSVLAVLSVPLVPESL